MNYDSLRVERSLGDRFPDGVEGLSLWRNVANEIPSEIPNFGSPSRRLQIPRVFVSYKTQDRALALRLAYLANLEGFEYWMDVLDPKLAQVNRSTRWTAPRKAVLVATIIEMALLNSSHVIATLTDRTAASKWVPYEFGRVKDDTVVAEAACTWVHPIEKPTLAEYLYLCPRHDTEYEVRQWLRSERAKWERKRGKKLTCPASRWAGGVPAALPR